MLDLSEQYNQIRIPEAKVIQEALRQKISLQPLKRLPEIIAGLDISHNRFSRTIYAGAVLMHLSDLEPFAYALAVDETRFPYIPGYLAFREVPALVKALQLLPQMPDLLFVDGHGIAHPRRMGIAAHIGSLLSCPSIGCAKKLLFGIYDLPPDEALSATRLMDKEEQLGFALRTKYKVKPVFISPGNMLSMQQALSIARSCVRKHRIPEPTRRAHEFVNLFRRGELQQGFHQL